MNYETTQIAELEKKIKELESLLNEAKESLKKESLNEKLQDSFASLKKSLEADFKADTNSQLNSLKNELKNENKANLKSIFESRENELLKEASKNINLTAFLNDNENLFLQRAQDFLNSLLNEEKNNNQNLLNELKQQSKNEIDRQLNETKENLAKKLASLDLKELAKEGFKKAIKEDLKDLKKESLSENKEAIAKELLRKFLSTKESKETLIEALKDILSQQFLQKDFKDEVEKILLERNHSILKQILSTKPIKSLDFRQSLVLSSVSLKTEINIIIENLDILNSLKARELRAELLSEGKDRPLLTRSFKVE